jgi:hypothetical protein
MNVPPQAVLPMAAAAANVSQPSPTLPAVASVPLQPALGAVAISLLHLPVCHLFKQVVLLPANNLLATSPLNNLVDQPHLELPVNVLGMVWEEDNWKPLSHKKETVHPCPWRIQYALGEWLEVCSSSG